MGLVSQIFNNNVIAGLQGTAAIGHTRYSTTGSSHIRNAQPLTGTCRLGRIAIAHNGNLTNAAKVRDELEEQGLMFQTSVDSEIILNLLAQPTLGGNDNNLVATMRRIEGAYSLAITSLNASWLACAIPSVSVRFPSVAWAMPTSLPAKPAPSI